MKQKSTNKSANNPVSKAPVKKENNKAAPKPFFLDQIIESHGIWITLGLVSLLILIIFHNFISGNVFYLFKDIGSDSLNGWFTNVALLSQYLHTDGFPLWSHAQGMGQNMMAATVTDPFSFIVLLFGPDNLPYGMVWMEICKILCTSFILYLFFKLWGISSRVVLIGTILYCFGGFMMVGGGWFQFSTEAFLLVFLLYSFEKLYRNANWYLFPLAIAVITSFQPVDLYFYGVFLILYILFRHFSSDKPSWLKIGKLALQMAGLTLLGLTMSSFFFLSQMQMLLDSPRVGGNSSHSAQLLAKPLFFLENGIYYSTAIMRLFSNDLLGNGSSYRGWYNYLEAPMWYIGLLPMLLMPQIFMLGTKRRKIVYGCLLFILAIPVIFPFFRYAVWLFTGDYYRGYSVFVSLFFLFAAMDVLHELINGKKINLYLLGGSLVVLLTLLYYPYADTERVINKDLRTVITNFIVLYGLLVVLSRFETYRSAIIVLLIMVVFFEMAYMNYKTVNDRVVLSKRDKQERAGYDDYTREAVAFIKSQDSQYYRINKDYSSNPAIHTSFNDAKVQGYYGTKSYHSFNQKYYIRFLEEMNIIKKGEETQTRWAIGLATRPLLQNFASTKYYLCKQPAPVYLKLSYDSVNRFGNVSVFRNKHFLPLGFTYDSYISLTDFQKASAMSKERIIQQAFVAEDPVDPRVKQFRQYDFKDTLGGYTFDLFYKNIDDRRQDTLSISRFSENRIQGTISSTTNKLLFFSIPYDKGWHAIIDGKPVQPMLCNLGFMGFFIDPGKHQVELFYRPPFFTLSLMLSIGGVLLYLGLIGTHSFLRKKKQVEK